MPSLKCDSATRVLFKGVKVKEGRKDKDIVRDMVSLYSKSKEHKFLAKERKDFLKKREREDKRKEKAQLKEKKEKAAGDKASRRASNIALGRGVGQEPETPEEDPALEQEPLEEADLQPTEEEPRS